MSTMKPSSVLAELQPASVWAHFATLCAIPRPSKGEARLREHLKDWAQERGFWTSVDAVGNLMVRKPASPGREGFVALVESGRKKLRCQVV